MKKGKSTERRLVKWINRLIDDGLSFSFLVLFLLGLYFVYDSGYVYYSAALSNISRFQMLKEIKAEEKAVTEDCVAWFEFTDTDIAYPIMQGEDNSEYLNKNAYGEYSLAGAIFLDSRNNKDFSDTYSIIYGHHMENRFMFGALDDFNDEEFFNEHNKGVLKINGEEHQLDLFAFSIIDANVKEIFNPDFFDVSPLSTIASNSIHYREPIGNRIIAFSTCKSPESTLRTIVFASIVD